MANYEKIALDVRELEHPIPLERAMYALRELDGENYLYMIHRKNPIPLIDLATEQGFNILSREDSSGIWHILISRNNDIDLDGLCNV
jgi:hypothetical protein